MSLKRYVDVLKVPTNEADLECLKEILSVIIERIESIEEDNRELRKQVRTGKDNR